MALPICERCWTRLGTPYSFHYGRLGADVRAPFLGGPLPPPSGNRLTIGGTDAAYVCRRCLRHARLRRARRLLVQEFTAFPLLLAYALPVLGAGAAMGRGEWVTSLLWLAVVATVPVAMLGLLYRLMQPQTTGELAAIELRRGRWQEQGWPDLWTTKEFARLLD